MSNEFVAVAADPSGNILDELEVELGDVGWVLNGIGSASLTLRTSYARARQDYFRLGSMLLLEFANGLPNWVGKSGGAQRIRWKPGGLMEVQYQSIEHLLTHRRSGKTINAEATTLEALIRNLIEVMNGNQQTPLRVGELWPLSPHAGREIHYQQIYDIVVGLQRDLGGDYAVTGGRGTGLNTHRLDLLFNYWARRGEEKPDVVLLEDHNATIVAYTEQDANFVNDWVVVGAGSSWDDARPEGRAVDANSIGKYGLFERAVVANELYDKAALDAVANGRLAASLRPYRALTLDVVDLAPAPFASYDLGDRVKVEAHSVGWEGLNELGRVTARTYNSTTGQSRVVLELDQ